MCSKHVYVVYIHAYYTTSHTSVNLTSVRKLHLFTALLSTYYFSVESVHFRLSIRLSTIALSTPTISVFSVDR
jgi:hypothetical protein